MSVRRWTCLRNSGHGVATHERNVAAEQHPIEAGQHAAHIVRPLTKRPLAAGALMRYCFLVRDLLKILRREVAKTPGVELALLFGSAATGTLRPDSDVDVAVLLDRDWPLAAELALQARLSRSVGREIDLIRIDHASTLLKWHMAREAVLIYAERPQCYSRFRSQAALEYMDFAPQHERALELFRRRLTRERT